MWKVGPAPRARLRSRLPTTNTSSQPLSGDPVLELEPVESMGFELQVSVFSDSPTLSVQAANMGIEVLMDHSRSNNLGPLNRIDAALPPVR